MLNISHKRVGQSTRQKKEMIDQVPERKYNAMNESMKLGLGAQKEFMNHKDRQEFLYE